MTRSEVIEVLEEYNKLLMSEGYADADLYGESENDSAIDRFMQTDWFKSHFLQTDVNYTSSVGTLKWDGSGFNGFIMDEEVILP